MKITVFTSTHLRHRYLINMLSKNFDKVLYISEKKPYIRSKKSNPYYVIHPLLRAIVFKQNK